MSEFSEADKTFWAKAKCEDSHLYFSRYFFKTRQSIKFKVNWHHQIISDHLQKVIDGEIKNLCICVPPGSSKTELAVINFIARGLAINPRARFLHLSGSDTLASLNSSTARDLILSEEYQKFWPIKIAEDAKSKKRWNVLQGDQLAGGVYATSLGGQITGFRAGHMAAGFQGCFVGETKILTVNGAKRIDEICTNDIVISYNHALKRLEPKRVLANKVSLRGDLAETIFKGRTRIVSTPCHRFYNGESYRPISGFSAGSACYAFQGTALGEVLQMWQNSKKATRRSGQSNNSKSEIYILFCQLFKRTRNRIKTLTNITKYKLSNMFKGFQAIIEVYSGMFNEMQEFITFEKNARTEQLELQRQQQLRRAFRETETADQASRQNLLSLWSESEINCSPYRRKCIQQRSSKLGHDVPTLSYNSPQITPVPIYSLKCYSSTPTKVYDIQVEGNHNFFAEGILVHNCLLIDDAIKPEDAFSRSKLDAANRKLLTTVKSRKASPDTPIVVIMQRIAESDAVGFIKQGNLGNDWTFLTIPAVITEAYVKTLDIKYQKMIDLSQRDDQGRLSYWPYKEPLDQLLAMERGDGADQTGSRISRHVFSSQYQQEPVALGGNIIKGENFVRYTVLPQLKYRKIFADTAQKTAERNDFSVFAEWGLGVDNKAYLTDMIVGKWEAPELQNRAVAFWHKCKAKDQDKMGQLREMHVEDKSSGTGLVQQIRYMNTIPIKPVERVKDKLTRVMDILPYIESRLVCVPEEAPFTNDFIQQCEAFTADNSHSHDDMLDTAIDGINELLSAGNKLHLWAKLAK